MKHLLLLFLPTLLLFSCETDSYDKGTGRYSLMLTDLAELSVNAEKQAVAFTTDDGDAYSLTSPMGAKWIATPDTTYRVLIYYNKVEQARQAEVVSVGVVATMLPLEHWKIKEPSQDPVGIESAWLSRSGKYLNMGLLFKSGRVDDEEGIHLIGIAQDTVLVNADQTRTAYYRFLHSQGDTPEYYTNRHYVSILLPDDRPDSVCLSVNTYGGVVTRRFALAQSVLR